MRSKTLLAVVIALCLPAAALATKPAHPKTPANSNASSTANGTTTTSTTSSPSPTGPKVQFVLRGTLSNYTAANGTTAGSITIIVTGSNFHAALKGSTITFALTSSTKVVPHDGKAIANNDHGIVKVRAAKHSSAATLATLTPSQLLDQG